MYVLGDVVSLMFPIDDSGNVCVLYMILYMLDAFTPWYFSVTYRAKFRVVGYGTHNVTHVHPGRVELAV
jgi:hypothetical protein